MEEQGFIFFQLYENMCFLSTNLSPGELCIGYSLCIAQRSTGEDVSGVEMEPLLSYRRPFSHSFFQRKKSILRSLFPRSDYVFALFCLWIQHLTSRRVSPQIRRLV